MNRFEESKHIFLDENKAYIEIAKFASKKNHIEDQVFLNKTPLTTITGYPGVGKTFLVKRVLSDLDSHDGVIYLEMPVIGIEEFVKRLAKEITGKTPQRFNLDKVIESLVGELEGSSVTVFVDEAQNYPEDQLDFIRMLSDKGVFKFVLIMHKFEKDSVVNKDHFRSRIWNIIELEPLNQSETIEYVEKIMLKSNLFDVVHRFSKKDFRFIYRVTKGNLRQINVVLYKLFDICDYFYQNNPNSMDDRKGYLKLLEMAAIDLRLIRA
ncbi:MAG: AAA family ATPase [Campylobacterales bacterium]